MRFQNMFLIIPLHRFLVNTFLMKPKEILWHVSNNGIPEYVSIETPDHDSNGIPGQVSIEIPDVFMKQKKKTISTHQEFCLSYLEHLFLYLLCFPIFWCMCLFLRRSLQEHSKFLHQSRPL